MTWAAFERHSAVNALGVGLRTALLSVALAVAGLSVVTPSTAFALSYNACGAVVSYTAATSTDAGALNLAGHVYPIAAGVPIAGDASLREGTRVCVRITTPNPGDETITYGIVIITSALGGVGSLPSIGSATPAALPRTGDTALAPLAGFAFAAGVLAVMRGASRLTGAQVKTVSSNARTSGEPAGRGNPLNT